MFLDCLGGGQFGGGVVEVDHRLQPGLPAVRHRVVAARSDARHPPLVHWHKTNRLRRGYLDDFASEGFEAGLG